MARLRLKHRFEQPRVKRSVSERVRPLLWILVVSLLSWILIKKFSGQEGRDEARRHEYEDYLTAHSGELDELQRVRDELQDRLAEVEDKIHAVSGEGRFREDIRHDVEDAWMHDGEEDDWGGGARPAAPHVSRAPDEQRAVGGQFRTAGPAVAKVVAGAEKRFAEETPRAGKAGEDALPAGKGGAGRVGPRATAPPAEHLLGGKRGHLPPAAGGVSGKKKAPRIAEKAKQQKGGGQERGRKHGPVPRKVPH